VLLVVIYTKQIKCTVTTDTVAFNWVLHNAGFKKRSLGFICLYNFISNTRRGSGGPIPGNIQGQAGGGSEQPDPVEDVPALCRGGVD